MAKIVKKKPKRGNKILKLTNGSLWSLKYVLFFFWNVQISWQFYMGQF